MGPPALLEKSWRTRDGVILPLRVWKAERPKAVIVALHGMNDYAKAFEMPGAWWAREGITVYAFDQRGFGESPQHGIWAGGDVLAEDARDLVALVRTRHPGKPVYLLGESMGGAVAIVAATGEEPLAADGLILSAPAVWGWSSLDWPARAALWITAHLQPWGPLEPPLGLKIVPSDNRAVLRDLSSDPLFIKETRSDALYGLVDLMEQAKERAARIGIPVLLLYGRRDDIIPPKPTIKVMRDLAAQARIALYDNGFHLLLRDFQREKVWRDIVAFVEGKGGPLPSGYERTATEVARILNEE